MKIFFNKALSNTTNGLALLANAISKRLNMSSGSFPSVGHLLALFTFIFFVRLLWIVFTYPYASYGALEEQLLELTAANNFVAYGFMKTLFLPDYVSSTIIADHAVVYTHMPPLAAIIVALLQKAHLGAFGIRLFFMSLNTFGLFYGYLFFKKIFNARVSFIIILLLSLNFKQSLEWGDHFSYSLIWLFLFGAAYHFVNFALENSAVKKKHEAILFLLIVLATSLTNYVMLLTQVVLLIMLYVFNIARPAARYMGLLLIAISIGVTLHLMQNIIYFGLPQFQEEISITLENRIFGQPSNSDLRSYFIEHNIVNWGVPRIDLKDYTKQLSEYVKGQLLFGRGYGWVLSILLVYAAGYNLKNDYKYIIYLLKVILAFLGAAISWYIVFPAHAQTYFLPICGWGVIPAIVMGGACVLSIESIKKRFHVWRAALIFLMVILLLIPVFESLKRTASSAYKEMKMSTYKTLANLGKYSDEVIWTNLDSVYISYFTHSVVCGRCTIEAVIKQDISFCDNIWINSRSLKNIELLNKPALFVYAKSHLSSTMTEPTPEHLEALQVYLDKNFHLIERLDNVMIYRTTY